MTRDGEGVTQDVARAAVLMKKACDDGDADGCRELGDIARSMGPSPRRKSLP